jgi:hypothetical protein
MSALVYNRREGRRGEIERSNHEQRQAPANPEVGLFFLPGLELKFLDVVHQMLRDMASPIEVLNL